MERSELAEGLAIRAMTDNWGHWISGQVFEVKRGSTGFYIRCDELTAHLLNEDDPEMSCLPSFQIAPQ